MNYDSFGLRISCTSNEKSPNSRIPSISDDNTLMRTETKTEESRTNANCNKGSSRSPEMPLGLRFPYVLGGGACGTHVPRAVLQLANEVLEVSDANWSRTIKVTCRKTSGITWQLFADITCTVFRAQGSRFTQTFKPRKRRIG